ncbi:SOS response-associated peptidase [Jejudonia soesokkakensis]|uniref:Abasic site processing protein n=1 Tax=Jejudonia soesokkakensis TaxID=1323432 RepID=A0ABW2MV88_9FLAO
MCYRTKLNSELSKIENSFNATFVKPKNYNPQLEINGFSFSPNPVILDEDRGHINFANWGLIPFWAKNDQIKKMTLNARIETANEKPAYRSVVKNRCLILADGYYEWQWIDPKGKEKQKYLIMPEDQQIFGFAGFYSDWTNPETNEKVTSYTIATTDANELMAEIHNNKKRMPIIIKEKDRNDWLNGLDLKHFAYPYDVNLKAEKV